MSRAPRTLNAWPAQEVLVRRHESAIAWRGPRQQHQPHGYANRSCRLVVHRWLDVRCDDRLCRRPTSWDGPGRGGCRSGFRRLVVWAPRVARPASASGGHSVPPSRTGCLGTRRRPDGRVAPIQDGTRSRRSPRLGGEPPPVGVSLTRKSVAGRRRFESLCTPSPPGAPARHASSECQAAGFPLTSAA